MKFDLDGNQKYRCSQCKPIFIPEGNHYTCDEKCKKTNR